MTKYVVVYSAEFWSDLSDSFEWGAGAWGSEAATEWYNELEYLVQSRLSSFPESCSLAPENHELVDADVRQLNFGRYRILFTIREETVRVLHLRGPYSGMDE